MGDDKYDDYTTKWDPMSASAPWPKAGDGSWAPGPLAREVVAMLIMTPLTPLAVMLLFNIAMGVQQVVERGYIELWGFLKLTAFTSALAIFFGFKESLLGSFVIVALGRTLARFDMDAMWVSLILGTVVGLTVPDAPSVLLGLADGQSLHEAIADRTWRGFWPFFGLTAAMMGLLNWCIAIRPRRMERLAQEREAMSAGPQG